MRDSEQDQLTATVKELCAQGYSAYDAKDYDQALRLFYQAWLSLPKPQTDYPQAGWVLAAIGDCYFKMGKLEQAQEALESCCHCPGMADNPFVQMRLGQVLLDSQHLTQARKHLNKAYHLGGEVLFATEQDYYLDSIRDLLS